MFGLKNKNIIILLHTLLLKPWENGSYILSQVNKIFESKIVNFFLPINFNICFGCSKDSSHWDRSFEYLQHMFWLRNKKISILILKSCTMKHYEPMFFHECINTCQVWRKLLECEASWPSVQTFPYGPDKCQCNETNMCHSYSYYLTFRLL